MTSETVSAMLFVVRFPIIHIWSGLFDLEVRSINRSFTLGCRSIDLSVDLVTV